MTPYVRVVVPCFNEASRLEPSRFIEFAATHPDIALLFVDDASSDATGAMLTSLAARAGNITTVTLPRRGGKGEAVRRGLMIAAEQGAEFAGFWDADLSTPLSALPDFVDVLTANPRIDIVMGARVKLLGRDVRRRPLRHYAGRVFATAASFALGVGVYDTQCGAKLFRLTEPVAAALRTPFRSAWIFDVEILARYIDTIGAQEAASRIHELPLPTWTDVPGSKLRLPDVLRAAWDLARLARTRLRTARCPQRPS